MNFQELQKLIKEAMRSKPWAFEDGRESPIASANLKQIEKKKKVRFPECFREFISEYGAGEFGFGSIYSPDPESAASLWNDIDQFLDGRSDFLPFSDNGGGDYLAFPVEDGVAIDRVIYLDHENDYKSCDSEFSSFGDYVVQACLQN